MYINEKDWILISEKSLEIKLVCDICNHKDDGAHNYYKADYVRLEKLYVQNFYKVCCQKCRNIIYFTERKKLIVK